MIKASHNRGARLVFNYYISRLLRKNFSKFYLINKCPLISGKVPLVITPNHISWWDGFFIDYINTRILKRTIYIMMLETQLKRYWFFRYLGAYSIKQENPKSILETACYFREVTNDPYNLNVIYPQGEISPFEKRTVLLRHGLKYFLKGIHDSALVLPVHFKIQYQEEKKPAVYCRFAEPAAAASVVSNFENYKKMFEDGLCSLDEASQSKEVYFDLFTEK